MWQSDQALAANEAERRRKAGTLGKAQSKNQSNIMNLKLFEIRDAGTFIPVFAFNARAVVPNNDAEKFLLRRSGFGVESDCVVIGRLDCSMPAYSHCTYDPYAHGASNRTFQVAHKYIEDHFDELSSGDVIDVEFILGEAKEKKVSERLYSSL